MMMMTMMMMMMIMMMIIAIFVFLAITPFLGLKPKNELFLCKKINMNIAVTQSIFKLGPPDFTWK